MSNAKVLPQPEAATTEAAKVVEYVLTYNDKTGQPIAPTTDATAEVFGIKAQASTAPFELMSAVMAVKTVPLADASVFALWGKYNAELAIWQAENDGKAKLEALPEYKVYLAAVAAAQVALDAATADIPEIQAMATAGTAMSALRMAVQQARTTRGNADAYLFIVPKRNTSKGKADKA